MIRAAILACLVIPVAVFCVSPAHGMRCGTQLVRLGNTTSDVREKCGEPTEVEVWYETIPGWRLGLYDMEPYRDTGLPIYRYELWTYNFGSTRFIRYLTFKDGRLEKISRGDYGY